jgi:hypothetical protein
VRFGFAALTQMMVSRARVARLREVYRSREP